jgi:hypothetical protein
VTSPKAAFLIATKTAGCKILESAMIRFAGPFSIDGSQVSFGSSKCYAIEVEDLAIIPGSEEPFSASGRRAATAYDNRL